MCSVGVMCSFTSQKLFAWTDLHPPHERCSGRTALGLLGLLCLRHFAVTIYPVLLDPGAP